MVKLRNWGLIVKSATRNVTLWPIPRVEHLSVMIFIEYEFFSIRFYIEIHIDHDSEQNIIDSTLYSTIAQNNGYKKLMYTSPNWATPHEFSFGFKCWTKMNAPVISENSIYRSKIEYYRFWPITNLLKAWEKMITWNFP